MPTMNWSSFYSKCNSGGASITGETLRAFGAQHAGRVLDTQLWGKDAKVLLLDVPFSVGAKIEESPTGEYRLHRIRLNSLPGWPPHLASTANVRALPDLMSCTLLGCAFTKGNGPGQDAVELILGHDGRSHRAWHVGCPVPLLRCVAATLNRGGAIGALMSDIQDVQLVGAD